MQLGKQARLLVLIFSAIEFHLLIYIESTQKLICLVAIDSLFKFEFSAQGVTKFVLLLFPP